MSKVILGDRVTKTITLPETGAEVIVYASVLAVDMQGLSQENLEGKESITEAIKFITRLIKSWNIFASEKEESPREINEDSVGLLPVEDLVVLLNEIQAFAVTEKKDSPA